MTVSWQIEGDVIHITASAPTTGWLAVGFNTEDTIVGANLIMGAVVDAAVHVEDRYVVAAGDPRAVTELGGISAVDAPAGSESQGQTTISFRMPTQAVDAYHLALHQGSTLYLIAAYSVDDDFAHHSRMRRHVEVTL